MSVDAAHAHFWSLAESWLAQDEITKSTMMGFPCLRVNGDFFASIEHKGDGLVCKVSADRVNTLIAEGIGEPFAPNGRRFKEWVRVPWVNRDQWPAVLEEAHRFVG